jgi:phosphomevalonate kinase
LRWSHGKGEYKLVDDIWRTANARAERGFSIRLDSREFVDNSGRKIGVGSSAALCVALSAALCEATATDAPAAPIAYAAHRQFQGGLGSGADIACSLGGGLIDYSMGDRYGRQLSWPKGLSCFVLWSGIPVNTENKLNQLGKQDRYSSRDALVDAARKTAASWGTGSSEDILSEYRHYCRVLQEFGVDHNLGIFDAGHDDLAAAAEKAGLVYKPCGAGGGDVGVLLGDDDEKLMHFISNSMPAGFERLDMQIDLQGLQVHRENT